MRQRSNTNLFRDIHKIMTINNLNNLTVIIALLLGLGGNCLAQPQLPSLGDAQLQACVHKLMQKYQWQTAEAVSEIHCHGQKIQSLAGIEQFTGLQKLSLYNNQLSEVNLQGLKQLRHLNLAKNTIVQLRLSDLPALRELYVFGNKLPRVQLTQLPQLKLLKINDNQLQEFTYQELPALEKIYLFNNPLEHIDIYHLPALRYMDARQNPMPDKLYEEMDQLEGVTFLHDGNAEDWQ